jgi:hypothetical protein
VYSAGSFEIDVEFDGTSVAIREMMRADLDGDGCEDLLVSIYVRVLGGTFGEGQPPAVLARRGPSDLFALTTPLPRPDATSTAT